MFFDFCIGKVHTLSAVNYLVNLRRSVYDLVTIFYLRNGVPFGYDNVVYYVVVHNTIVMFAVCPR